MPKLGKLFKRPFSTSIFLLLPQSSVLWMINNNKKNVNIFLTLCIYANVTKIMSFYDHSQIIRFSHKTSGRMPYRCILYMGKYVARGAISEIFKSKQNICWTCAINDLKLYTPCLNEPFYFYRKWNRRNEDDNFWEFGLRVT